MGVGVTDHDGMVRVVIVEDHPLFVVGLEDQFENDPSIEVVASFGTAVEAVREIPRLRPSVTLMDLQLPWADGSPATYCGAQAIKQIRQDWPEATIAVITMFTQKERVREAIKAGAQSYFLKDAPAHEVIQKVHWTAQGKGVFDPVIARLLPELMPVSIGDAVVFAELSRRENEILTLAAAGQSNPQIARDIGISEKTVANNMSNILAKLGVSSRDDAVALTRVNGRGHDDGLVVPGPAE